MTLKQALNICSDTKYYIQCWTKGADGYFPPSITLDFTGSPDLFDPAMMKVYAYQKQPHKVTSISYNKPRGCLEINFILTAKGGSTK